jgi:glycosyltransferase involved in cell wall biosynthesis
MSDKLGVVFCTDGIFPHQIGGMQRHSRLLIEELSNYDIDLIVIHPHKETTIFQDKKNIKEYSLEGINPNKNYLIESYNYSKKVFDVVKKYPNYLVYSQGLSVWYNAYKISNKLIINPHGLEPFQTFGFKNSLIALPFKLIFKHLFNKARFVVSLGGSLTNILNKYVDKQKIVTLANAVDLPKKSPQKSFPDSNEPINCFFLARFAHNKGIHILLDVVKELNAEGYQNKFHFRLGGKGPLYDDAIKTYNFDNISFLGFVSDDELIKQYEQADVFVFPTLYEGMPTVVLEAMSYKLPIIVSNTGATSELVDDSNGFLITPNSKSSLKESLLSYLIMSSHEKERLAVISYEKVKQNFTWNKIAKAHMDIFTKMK